MKNMKKIWKIFFIAILLFGVFGFVLKTHAEDEERNPYLVPEEEIIEVERPQDVKDIAVGCPDPGDPRLISICGSVRQGRAVPMRLPDGSTAPSVSQVPVKGVSVYLYECDNSSPTCKKEGYLVHPFSSTSTNEEGRFHLIARKVDNSWKRTYEYWKSCEGKPGWKVSDFRGKVEVDMLAQSKKRYLVFKCNDNFQGIHVIPSYENLTEVIHEVNCGVEYDDDGNEIPLEYMPPYKQFDFVGINKLANHMGIDPEEYKVKQITGNNDSDGYSLAAQAYFEKYKDEKVRSMTVNLKGADPRFTKPEEDSPKRKALTKALDIWGGAFGIHNFPTEGAWYSTDCEKVYAGSIWEKFCGGMGKSDADKEEILLYTEPERTTQHLLPGIPPKYSLLFYRPLEIRVDMTGYYQDHDDIAKYLGLQFSNCVGEVYKRNWNLKKESEEEEEEEENGMEIEEKKPQYPTCESLRECNATISSGTGLNSHITGGPAQAFTTPNQFEDIAYDNLESVPVCVTRERGEKNPITIGEIQKPGEPCSQGKVLCDGGVYWNNYYLTNLGANNKALKWGFIEEARDDSISSPETNPCNQEIFKGGEEGKGLPQSGCNSATAGSGDRAGNNSFGAMAQITGLDESSSMGNTTDFVAQPFETDENKRKELMSGAQYLISYKPVAWGQYSEANKNDQQLILNSEYDKDVYDNYFNNPDNECLLCNKNHYPGDDLIIGGSPPMGGEESGTRTQSTGIYMTSAAYNRVENLKDDGFLGIKGALKDMFDSTLSISSGHGYIDWEMARVKGEPPLGHAFSKIASFLSKNSDKRKTFTDRKTGNKALQLERAPKDALLVTGFEVNQCNFGTLFPCIGAVEKRKDPTDQWGDGGGCYPWNPVDACEHAVMDSCGSYSRTCRVDLCESGVITAIFHCRPDGTYHIIKKVLAKEGVCSDENWNTCVGGKKSGVEPKDFGSSNCIADGYEPGPKDHPIRHIDVFDYDYCTISEAGPYACDGNLEHTAIINNTQQDIENKNMDSINVDKVSEAGQKLYKGFRTPGTPDITIQPGAWVSLSSSITNTRKPSLTKRKDVVGIGSGVNYLVRAHVGQPMASTSSKKLEPLYIHCQNTDIEEDSVGSWGRSGSEAGCNFEPLPDPEVLTLRDLKQALSETDGSCNFNDSQECANTFMGGGEFSETFTTVMNLAGNKFGVNPAAIFAYMTTIGTAKKYQFYWSKEGEDYLKEATLPWYGTFNFCDDLEPVAQHPFDWILLWFSMNATDGIPADEEEGLSMNTMTEAYSNISPGRERTLSRCNFMDAVFVLAHNLSRNIDGACPEQIWGNGKTKGTVAKALNLLNFGADPKGESKTGSEKTPIGENVWNACK
jgi:hypothetical protein